MEQGKGTNSSSSSLTSELSPSKASSSTPSTILESLIPLPSKSLAAKEKDSLNEILNTKPGTSGNPPKGHEGEPQSVVVFQENCIPPCNLSSSIFYGGQDNYPLPKTKQQSMYNDDESIGNWWKGSFYY